MNSTAPDHPADILGESRPLAKIFASGDYVFSIPNYQRPYAWTTEESEELLADVLAFLGDAPEADKTPVQDLRPYFLGSIVLIKQRHRPDATVVDGQQRLTTLTLIFALLRDLASSEERTAFTGFVRQEGNVVTGTQEQPRLTLRRRDEAYFRDHVQEAGRLAKIGDAEPENDAQRNIRDNAVRLHFLLSELSPVVRQRLGAYLAQRCFLVVVSTPDQESAYRIFSVMNNRGMDLTATDILKADVIGELAKQAPEVEADYSERWESTEEAIGRDRFLELFGHIRTIHQKVKRKETLLDEVRKHVRPSEHPRSFIDDELLPYAKVFVQAREAAYGTPGSTAAAVRSINQSLRWLGRVDNSDWLPAAMVLIRHTQDDDRLAQALARLERLASAMMVYRANVNGRVERYAALLTHLEGERTEDGPPAWSGDALAEDSPLDLRPEEHGLFLDALDGDVYAVTRTRLFVLLRLNDALSDGAASYDPPVITVEHVLPQNPAEGSAWMEQFPDAETREAYVHKLGNLVLLSRQRNASAGRLPFDKKKTSYFGTDSSSAFVLTSKVLHESEWTPDVVEERQANLIGVLARAWDLNLDRWRHGVETTAGTLDTSVLGYLTRSGPQTRALFERLDERLLALSSVERIDTKSYLGYKRTDAGTPYFACVKIQPATSTVLVYADLSPDKVDLRDGFTRDVHDIGHNGRGDLEIRIRSDGDLREADTLLRRAHESANGM